MERVRERSEKNVRVNLLKRQFRLCKIQLLKYTLIERMLFGARIPPFMMAIKTSLNFVGILSIKKNTKYSLFVERTINAAKFARQ